MVATTLPELKSCRRCKQRLPLEQFALTGEKLRPWVRRSKCRPCQAEHDREYAALHRDRLRAYHAARYDANRSTVMSRARAWKERNPERFKAYVRKSKLATYGLTPESYDALLASQHGRCAICGQPPSNPRRGENVLLVDHCHATGRVRGLLCTNCNIGLGNMQDDPARCRAAANYLEKARA